MRGLTSAATDVRRILLQKRYAALGGQMQLIVPPGQGHNMWTGFFQSQELINFVTARAK